MNKNKIKHLDTEEKDLEDALKKLNVKKISRPTELEQKQFKAAAGNFVKKETKMNIRIDQFELEKIKERAENEGLKYSTLIKSVMHKYITGQLVEGDLKKIARHSR